MPSFRLVLAVLLTCVALLPSSAAAQAPAEPTTLTVVERATARAEPDAAQLRLGIRRRATTRLRARRGVPRRTRYDARTTLTVETRRVDLVARVVVEAERSGVDDVFGPDFSVQDATEARAAAARTALERARRRAADAAAAVGLRVLAIRTVVLDPQTDEFAGAGERAGAGARSDSGSRVALEPGTEEVAVTVAVVFVLGP